MLPKTATQRMEKYKLPAVAAGDCSGGRDVSIRYTPPITRIAHAATGALRGFRGVSGPHFD